ncbi:MAG: hypothetical protein ACLP1X_17190 [Polyangiaceae bacterium]
MRGTAGWSVVLAAAVSACGNSPLRIAALDDMERVRVTAGAREGAEIAPEAFAHAEQERDMAQRAHAARDDVGARLYAERAIAAYQHALVLARLTRAATELADAQKTLDDATAQRQAIEVSRATLDADAATLEQRAQVERERLLPALSASASGDREAARLVATRSIALEAHLLCGAARLVAPDTAGLKDAEDAVGKVEAQVEKKAHPAPVDDATRVRAQCLEVLTRGRRVLVGEEGRADVLLAELSAAGGWEPSRDERGVVVTLRGVFRGVELTEGAAAKVKELGRVAGAHPGFGVQVVVHDVAAPGARDEGDAKRAEAMVKALVAGGADGARVHAELAGARLPVVDPGDAKGRGRNERVEVVFVPPGR